MQLYLDTSALVKLVVAEPETDALRHYLADHRSDTRISAALARTELLRAVSLRGSLDLVENARKIITRLQLVALTTTLLNAAATLMPRELRSLDAIHLAAAQTVPDLRAMVTYDLRLADAATRVGITTVAPR